MLYVPVVDKDQNPLMPTTANRAASWIKSRKATPFWKKGVFCVRLNVEPSGRKMQPIAVGIDPGSKKEGFTVKSSTKTFLNVQTDAVTWVKSALETRRNLRRCRRSRNTPCRPNRSNRTRGGVPPSTKARWQWKLRIVTWLKQMFPITIAIMEDIKAKSKKAKPSWNKSFSPLQVGKAWFYKKLKEIFPRVETRAGFQTSEWRQILNLPKLSDKMSDDFHAHCVDSWVLANSICGNQDAPDNTKVLLAVPLQFHRRQLHRQNFNQGGIRTEYGTTRSLSFQRGSLVKSSKYGLCYVGGSSNGKISLHEVSSGKRICQNAKPESIKFLTHSSWRWHSSHP